MKEKNVKRINTLGKVTKILTRIAMVFVIIGSVAMMALGIFMLTIPNDSVRIEGGSNAEVSITGIPKSLISLGMDEPVKVITANGNVNVSKEMIEFDEFQQYHIEDMKMEGNTFSFRLTNKFEDDFDFASAKMSLALAAIGSGIAMAALAVGLGFAASLSKALETCQTPFSEDIVKRMKRFGFSMIPYAILGGVDGIAVIVLLLMIFVFTYGCSIQAENDDVV